MKDDLPWKFVCEFATILGTKGQIVMRDETTGPFTKDNCYFLVPESQARAGFEGAGPAIEAMVYLVSRVSCDHELEEKLKQAIHNLKEFIGE